RRKAGARAEIVGIEVAGDPKLGDRFFVLAAIDEAEAEVHVRIGVVVLEADRQLILVDRHLVGLRREEAREVVVRGWALGLEAERFEILLEREPKLALLAVDGR